MTDPIESLQELARAMQEDGRDETVKALGRKLESLIPALEEAIRQGQNSIVLHWTEVTKRLEAEIAALKETMACGHPKACWEDWEPDEQIWEPGGGSYTTEKAHKGYCTACEHERLAVAAALREAANNCRARATAEMIMRDEARKLRLSISIAHGDRAAVLQEQEQAILTLIPPADQKALDAYVQEKLAEHNKSCWCPTCHEPAEHGNEFHTEIHFLNKALVEARKELENVQEKVCEQAKANDRAVLAESEWWAKVGVWKSWDQEKESSPEAREARLEMIHHVIRVLFEIAGTFLGAGLTLIAIAILETWGDLPMPPLTDEQFLDYRQTGNGMVQDCLDTIADLKRQLAERDVAATADMRRARTEIDRFLKRAGIGGLVRGPIRDLLQPSGRVALDAYVQEKLRQRDVEWTNAIWKQDVDFVETPSTVEERFQLHVRAKVDRAVLVETEGWHKSVSGYGVGGHMQKWMDDRLAANRAKVTGE